MPERVIKLQFRNSSNPGWNNSVSEYYHSIMGIQNNWGRTDVSDALVNAQLPLQSFEVNTVAEVAQSLSAIQASFTRDIQSLSQELQQRSAALPADVAAIKLIVDLVNKITELEQRVAQLEIGSNGGT